MVHAAIKISVSIAWITFCLAVIVPFILDQAYQIRLEAINEYGPIIHEFDPYFNYRATEYLYEHGRKKFFQWFDYMVWYPLGRPVGTTIYPGMQFTAVWIKNHVVGDAMSLNDVCCYIPAWFGVIASFVTGLIAYEITLECNCSNSILVALWDIITGGEMCEFRDKLCVKSRHATAPVLSFLCATATMAVIPAHLMRSVGGGFDNESVAMTAMVLTFYFWVRSLRAGDDKSWMFGVLAGAAYFYMVAAWGGYVFVLNMIGVHAGVLVLLGRFSTKVYLSYSLFYAIGTTLAIQVPVVGWTPLKSLEQLGPCAVFIGYQVLQFCEITIKKKGLSRKDAWNFRMKVIIVGAIVGIVAIVAFTPTGYFGPISSRVRGLFVKHTKTGNPLVDSVAEHQPAKANSYFQYLHHFCMIAPLGLVMVLVWFGDSPSFVAAYAITAYFFSHKMVRLILLMAPVTSILGGVAIGRICAWSLDQIWEEKASVSESESEKKGKPSKKKKAGKKIGSASNKKGDSNGMMALIKRGIAFGFIISTFLVYSNFNFYSWKIGKHLSNPSIIQIGQLKSGDVVKVDDYREAYFWIRENTPEDARVMAWWDYGYQLTAIANRTTIADGNTWNHEHIALLAKIFTGPVDEGYEIARHMADYIMVWAGGGGDDLAKSPHLARIANSVYRDMCGDPVCSRFGFTNGPRGRQPSPQMKRSLVNHLVSNRFMEGVEVDPKMFKEVYRTKYNKVRVYKIMNVDQESKNWVADPKNRDCDVEGGWFCRGLYPPALKEFIKKGKDFVQLEDFNKKDEDSEYQKQYFEGIMKKEERVRNVKKNAHKKKSRNEL